MLMHQFKEMLRHRFGQKSERYVDSDNPQFPLYDDNMIDDDTTALVPDDNVVDIQPYKRRKKAEKGFADHLPRKDVIIPVAEHDKTCECGCQKKVINHAIHERLNYLPPVYEVIVERREIMACPKGCEGKLVTADKPKHILPKSKFTAAVLAHIVVSKFDDRQPFYHLEKKFKKRAGFTLSRQTMARATIDCCDALHCDCDPFFNLLFTPSGVNPGFCNTHARRKFEPIANATQGNGLAKQAMAFYKRMYRIERHAKNEKMSVTQRYELRQLRTKPLMEEFKQWLDDHYPTVLPKSPLGRAFAYCLKHWNGLCEFLNDGRLEANNNLTEQEIKPFVIARKNFMFASSVDGAKALGLHFSLIRTAKLHRIDPYKYYVKILEDIPHCQKVEDYEALLPWNITLAKVGDITVAA